MGVVSSFCISSVSSLFQQFSISSYGFLSCCSLRKSEQLYPNKPISDDEMQLPIPLLLFDLLGVCSLSAASISEYSRPSCCKSLSAKCASKLTFHLSNSFQEIPCPTEEFFYTEVFVLAVDGPWKTYLWVATGLMMVTVFGQLGFYAICCVYYLYISTTVMLSSRTRKYQKSFFLGTIAQAFVPFVFIAIPVSAAISCIYFKYYNQVLNCAIVLFFSLHGFASTLVILLVHHPYRCYLIRVITFDRSVGEWNWKLTGHKQAVAEGKIDHFLMNNLFKNVMKPRLLG